MLRGEEYYLNEIYLSLLEPSLTKSNKEVFSHLKNHNLPSIQSAFIKKDIDYLNEINYVLSILTSIVSKPLLSSTYNEIVIRSGQAASIDNDDFNKTIKDASMWRRNKIGMIPERVYYKEHIDEIKTYENYLMVHIINAISKDIDNYSSFYSIMINRLLTTNNLTLKKNQVDIVSLIKRISNKLRYLKSTYFYKTINKEHHKIETVTPTNILLDNQLYNRAYRFYKEMIKYGDSASINTKLCQYYYFIIISTLLKKDYVIKSNKGKFSFIEGVVIENEQCKYELKITNNQYILINQENKLIKQNQKILLIVEHDLNQLRNEDEFYLDFDSVNFISIYQYGYIEDKKIYYSNSDPLKENRMIKEIISNHFLIVKGNELIYSKYCPICKKTELVNEDEIYICSACKSRYVLKDNKVIFIKIRRDYGRK